MNCLNVAPTRHLAATRRLSARLGNFSAVDVRCPLGCGTRILLVRVRRSTEEAIDVALRNHYRYDCEELKNSHVRA